MAKKVLIISTSLRNNSNSEILAREAERGAKEAGNDVELISLKNKTINFCRGCLTCQTTKRCVIEDDAIEITEKIKNSDVLIIATPIYYYEMSGQLKTIIDRANPLFVSEYKTRDVYLITTSADNDKNVVKHVIQGLNGWIACLSKLTLKNVVSGAGANNPFEIRQHSDVMLQAYELGKKV